MLLHLVKETDKGIIVRGAKYETAAAYANQAFVKPTIANWGDDKLSDYALGFICDMSAPGVKHICRTGFAGRAPAHDYPLSNRFDEVDTLVVFDDVLVPWENVLFYRHTRAASFIRGTLHRYSAFAFVQRIQKIADMLIGAALFNARQTGLDQQQAVREKLAELAVLSRDDQRPPHGLDRAGAEEPGRPADAEPVAALYRPRPGLHAAAGDGASGAASSAAARSASRPMSPRSNIRRPRRWLEKYYSVNENWVAEDRRKLLAFARDLMNSDYAGHRVTFELFAQSPPFAHLNAVYMNFDWKEPLNFVKKSAGLSDRVMQTAKRA